MELLSERLRCISLLNPFKLISSSQITEEIPNDHTVSHPDPELSASRLSQCTSSLITNLKNLNRTEENMFNSSAVSSPEMCSPEKDNPKNAENEIEWIRTSFLDIVRMLGLSRDKEIVLQVLFRLHLAQQLTCNKNNTITSTPRATDGTGPDHSCTILVIGKTGVGKSATINSIFGENKAETHAFRPATKKVTELAGSVNGLTVKIIDTPGLMFSSADFHKNKRILLATKKFIEKNAPDVVLFMDRLDMPNSETSDFSLLKIITKTLGAGIWYNTILVFSHNSSSHLSSSRDHNVNQEMLVSMRVKYLQGLICKAAVDVRLRVPVVLVENNKSGQTASGDFKWKSQFLLQCFACKVIHQVGEILNLQDSDTNNARGFAPLPYFLSFLIQSREQVHAQEDGTLIQNSDDTEHLPDSDEIDEFDELPPFKPLTKSQINELTKEQKKSYFDELDYREKLFNRKLSKEAFRRRKNARSEQPTSSRKQSTPEELEPSSVLDLQFPSSSFASDDHSYRYRCLDTTDQLLVRPDLSSNDWDHDCGFDVVIAEKMLVVKNKYPARISAQVHKDKNCMDFQFQSFATLGQRDERTTFIELNINTIEDDYVYKMFSETKFRNFKRNMTSAGLGFMLLSNASSLGLKLEDNLSIGNFLQLTLNGAAVLGNGDMASEGGLEIALLSRDQNNKMVKLKISSLNWQGKNFVGGDLLFEFPVGRNLTFSSHVKVHKNGTGQVSFNVRSSATLHLAILAFIPIINVLRRTICSSST